MLFTEEDVLFLTTLIRNSSSQTDTQHQDVGIHILATGIRIQTVVRLKSIDVMAHVLKSAPEMIRLAPGHATEEANRLVTMEGIPFREAFRRIAERHND